MSSDQLSLTYRAIEELRPNPSNARTHGHRQLGQLKASIEHFGFTAPILVDETGEVLAGHGRLEVARQLKMPTVPVVVLSHLSAQQKRALMLADNKIAMNAGWNLELLKVEITALSALDLSFDISVTGFSTPEIDVILGEPEPVPDRADQVDAIDRSVPAITQPGDVWWAGEHRIVCGSALDEAAYSSVMGEEKAEQVVTDPPYNVSIDGHVVGLGAKTHAEFAMASGEMSQSQFTDFLTHSFRLMAANSVGGAILMSFMDWRHLVEIQAAGMANAFELKNICVWVKTNAGMGSLYRSQHELVLIFKSGTTRHINNIELGKHGRYRTNVWEYAGVNTFKRGRSRDLETHPTVKPIAMIVDAIKDCSNRGGIVLDPFGGSGTTLLAAERTGRRARLIEIDPYYVDATVRRFEAMAKKAAILATTGENYAVVAARRASDIAAMPAIIATPSTPRRRAKRPERTVGR